MQSDDVSVRRDIRQEIWAHFEDWMVPGHVLGCLRVFDRFVHGLKKQALIFHFRSSSGRVLGTFVRLLETCFLLGHS